MQVSVALGDTGAVVAEIQSRLSRLGYLSVDGSPAEFDGATDRAVRAFQQDRQMSVDGIVGPLTFRQLEEARWQLGDRVLWYSAAHPHVGDDVQELQRRLADLGFAIGRVDGIFGANTDAAIREFQRNVGMTADGTCGVNTVVALQRLARAVRGGAPERLWDEHVHASNRTGIADKIIVIDPGHGGDDQGVEGYGLTEAMIAEDLARRVEGRLAAIGTQVVMTRPRSVLCTEPVSEAQRAAVANDVGADLVISIHLDASETPKAQGAASYYFGNSRNYSVLGQRFAEAVQEQLSALTDLTDCHTHAKGWDLLRMTRMPAVRVEVGYLSHRGDANRLAQPRFRATVAEAIAAAAVQFFAPASTVDEVSGQQAMV